MNKSITSYTSSTSKTSYTFTKKSVMSFFKISKSEGNSAWIGGMYLVLMIFVLYMLFLQRTKMDYIVENVEDILTTSTLGGLAIDTRALALTNDLILSQPDESKDTILMLIGDNLRMTQSGNVYSGHSPVLNSDFADAYVKNLTIYNVYATGDIEIIRYVAVSDTDPTLIKTIDHAILSDGIKNPQGETITETGTYIEFVFPIRVCGFNRMATKGEFVTVEQVIMSP